LSQVMTAEESARAPTAHIPARSCAGTLAKCAQNTKHVRQETWIINDEQIRTRKKGIVIYLAVLSLEIDGHFKQMSEVGSEQIPHEVLLLTNLKPTPHACRHASTFLILFATTRDTSLSGCS
jgi:hypothetical protein